MNRSLPLGLCIAATVFAIATAPVTALAATDSSSLDITAQVGPVLSLTIYPPGNPLVDAIGTVNVGTVTILSNASLGFDLTIAGANAGSALIENDGGPTTIPYSYFLEYFYGVLGIATPTGPFSDATATTTSQAGKLIAFRSAGQPSTNVTYGVQLKLDTSSAVDGIYVDTLLFTLTDD